MRSAQHLSYVAAFACFAALPGTTGIPFAYNPFTTNEYATSLLSHKSPAYGGIPADLDVSSIIFAEVSYPIITDEDINPAGQTAQIDKSATTNDSPKHGATRERKLEASNTDIQLVEAHFGMSLELNVKNMNASAGYYVMPWPSSYWAAFEDGINHRWSSDNDPSPAEKYATAFGLDSTVFMDAISASTGILAHKTSTGCSSNTDCSGLNDGSQCAIRSGEQQGYCVPTWYGICHAWAPAALLEPEPRCAVQKNGVTFEPMDIKALLSQVYDDGNLGTVFTGARYYGSDSNTSTDQYGRYTDGSRRDLGPGFLHVALTNILGRFNYSVVVDVTGGAEVWNQPVNSYEILNQTEMTPSEAATKYYGQETYPFNSAAMRIMYTEMKLTWMVEAYENGGLVSSARAASYTKSDTYTYLLELDNDYNILGGEWVGKSMADHPDFLWFPTARPSLNIVTGVGLSYQNVRELLDLATNCA